MATITVSGSLTIDVEGLEEQLQKLTALKTKIDAKIEELIQKISKVAEADNWPDLQEGSEKLKEIYNKSKERVEENIERIKKEVNAVLASIQKTESNIQNKFGELLVNFGKRLIDNPTDTPADVDPDVPTPEPTPANLFDGIKQGVQNVVNRIKENTEAFKQRITNLNSTGTIKTLFDKIKNSEFSIAFRRAFGLEENPTTPSTPTIIPAKPNLEPFINPYVCAAQKPILYLYPTEDNTNIDVTFEKPELLTTSYPKYDNSWNVTANKNGDLYTNDGKYYYGLYWEDDYKPNEFNEGFYVTKDNAINFLEDKLTKIGLNDRERNEFIMYWLPKLENNGKSIVNFEFTEDRDAFNKLNINPQPDSILRLLMNVKKVDEEVNIPEQELKPFERKGFVAVEWGGTEQ